MNRYWRLIGGTWVLAVLVIAASVAAWSTAVPTVVSVNTTSTRIAGIEDPAPAVDSNDLATSAQTMLSQDPFRFDHEQTAVRFNPAGMVNQAGAIPPPAPARPALRLVGIIGGPPWTALVEGVPGREGGVLIRLGEETGGLRLALMRGDTAVLTGFDTTWVLRAGPTWR
jgi:hypothetical protein